MMSSEKAFLQLDLATLYDQDKAQTLTFIRQKTLFQKSLPTLQKLYQQSKSVFYLKDEYFNENLGNLEVLFNENAKISALGVELVDSFIEILTQTIDTSATDAVRKTVVVSKTNVKKNKDCAVPIIHLIAALAKQCPKLIQPYWKSLFPLLIKLSEEYRIDSYKLLTQLLSNSQKYLQICVHSDRVSSFTSLSQQLSDLISSLFDFLLTRSFDDELLLLLKVLCENCPMEKLRKDYAFILYIKLKEVAGSLSIDVLQGILFSFTKNDLEISLSRSEISKNALDISLKRSEISKNDLESSSTRNEIIKGCLEISKIAPATPKIQISILNIIKTIQILCPEPTPHIKSILKVSLNSQNTDILIAASQALLEYSKSIQDQDWWIETIETINNLFSHKDPKVRSLSIDFISNPPNEIFQINRLRFHLIILILQASKDPIPEVRQSSCGALGMYVNVPEMQNGQCLGDFGDALESLLEDANLKTRTKAFWALGNLADVLGGDGVVEDPKIQGNEIRDSTKIHDNEGIGGKVQIENELLAKLLQHSIQGLMDNEKVFSR
jgi:hypothetical protein